MAIRRSEGRPGRYLVLWLICQCSTSIALAQTWRVEPSFSATVTATNNSGFANFTDAGEDVVLDLVPRAALTGRGARYKIDGSAEASALTYARNTTPNEFSPKANLAGNANAVERWLYLDASAALQHVTSNPFSAASNATVPSKRERVKQYRLSPYLDHAFTPAHSLLYRYESVWARASGDVATSVANSGTDLHRHALSFTQQPLPFGYALEAEQEETEFLDNASPRVEFASVRGVLTYAVDPTLILGGVAGAERSQIASSTSQDRIRGVRVRWRPTERTDLEAAAERRFFGAGWNLLLSHRTPFVAMKLNMLRQPASQPSSLQLSNSGGGTLRSLFDAAYSTRFPNPIERAAIVDAALARLGSQASPTGPIAVFSDYAQLERRAELTVAFLSPRSVLTLGLFASELRQLQRPDAPPLALPLPDDDDSAQIGGSLSVDRRLTSMLSVAAVLSGVHIEGRGSAQGQASTTKSGSLTGTRMLGPRTRANLGLRRQIAKSTAVPSVQETAAFLGIDYRF